MKRNIPSTPPARLYHHRPRVRTTDNDTIQRMIANLPPKRTTRRVIQFNEDETRVRNQSVVQTNLILRRKLKVASGLSRLAHQRSRAAAERQASASLPSSPGSPQRNRAFLARKRATPPVSPLSTIPGQVSGLSTSAPATPMARPARPSSVPVPVSAATRNLRRELDSEDVALCDRVNVFRLRLTSGLKALKRAKATVVSKAVTRSSLVVTRGCPARPAVEEASTSEADMRGRTTRRTAGTFIRSSSHSVQVVSLSKETMKRSVSLDNKKRDEVTESQSPSLDLSVPPEPVVGTITRSKVSKRSKESLNTNTVPNETTEDVNLTEEGQVNKGEEIDDDLTNCNKETSSILAAMRLAMMESENTHLTTESTLEIKVEELDEMAKQISGKRTRSKTYSDLEENITKKSVKKVKINHSVLKSSTVGYDNTETVQEPLVCGSCNLQLSNLSALERHQKKCMYIKPEPATSALDDKDTGEKQLCQHCGKYFSCSPSFWRHLKVCSIAISQTVKETTKSTERTSSGTDRSQVKKTNELTSNVVVRKESVPEQNIASPISDIDDKMPELEKVEPIEVVKRVTRSRKEDLSDIPILSPVINDTSSKTKESIIENDILVSGLETGLSLVIPGLPSENRKSRRRQRRVTDNQIEVEPSSIIQEEDIKPEPRSSSVDNPQSTNTVEKTRRGPRISSDFALIVANADLKPVSPKRKGRNVSRSKNDGDEFIAPEAELKDQLPEKDKAVEVLEFQENLVVQVISKRKHSRSKKEVNELIQGTENQEQVSENISNCEPNESTEKMEEVTELQEKIDLKVISKRKHSRSKKEANELIQGTENQEQVSENISNYELSESTKNMEEVTELQEKIDLKVISKRKHSRSKKEANELIQGTENREQVSENISNYELSESTKNMEEVNELQEKIDLKVISKRKHSRSKKEVNEFIQGTENQEQVSENISNYEPNDSTEKMEEVIELQRKIDLKVNSKRKHSRNKKEANELIQGTENQEQVSENISNYEISESTENMEEVTELQEKIDLKVISKRKHSKSKKEVNELIQGTENEEQVSENISDKEANESTVKMEEVTELQGKINLKMITKRKQSRGKKESNELIQETENQEQVSDNICINEPNESAEKFEVFDLQEKIGLKVISKRKQTSISRTKKESIKHCEDLESIEKVQDINSNNEPNKLPEKIAVKNGSSRRKPRSVSRGKTEKEGNQVADIKQEELVSEPNNVIDEMVGTQESMNLKLVSPKRKSKVSSKTNKALEDNVSIIKNEELFLELTNSVEQLPESQEKIVLENVSPKRKTAGTSMSRSKVEDFVILDQIQSCPSEQDLVINETFELQEDTVKHKSPKRKQRSSSKVSKVIENNPQGLEKQTVENVKVNKEGFDSHESVDPKLTSPKRKNRSSSKHKLENIKSEPGNLNNIPNSDLSVLQDMLVSANGSESSIIREVKETASFVLESKRTGRRTRRKNVELDVSCPIDGTTYVCDEISVSAIEEKTSLEVDTDNQQNVSVIETETLIEKRKRRRKRKASLNQNYAEISCSPFSESELLQENVKKAKVDDCHDNQTNAEDTTSPFPLSPTLPPEMPEVCPVEPSTSSVDDLGKGMGDIVPSSQSAVVDISPIKDEFQNVEQDVNMETDMCDEAKENSNKIEENIPEVPSSPDDDDVQEIPRKRSRNQVSGNGESAVVSPLTLLTRRPRKSHRHMTKLSLTSLSTSGDTYYIKKGKNRSSHRNKRVSQSERLDMAVSTQTSELTFEKNNTVMDIKTCRSLDVDNVMQAAEDLNVNLSLSEIDLSPNNSQGMETSLSVSKEEECFIKEDSATETDYFEMDEESLPISKLRDANFMLLYHKKKSTSIKTISAIGSHLSNTAANSNSSNINIENADETSPAISASVLSVEESLVVEQNGKVENVADVSNLSEIKDNDEPKNQEDTTSFVTRERSVRITRWNLSYEEMYTSSDVASETDSQEFDSNPVKELAEVTVPEPEKIRKLTHKRNGIVPKRNRKAQIKRNKNLKLHLSKNKRSAARKKKFTRKKTPSDVKENAKSKNDDVCTNVEKIEGTIPPGVLKEQHQTTVLNSVSCDVTENSEISKDEKGLNEKKRKRQSSVSEENPHGKVCSEHNEKKLSGSVTASDEPESIDPEGTENSAPGEQFADTSSVEPKHLTANKNNSNINETSGSESIQVKRRGKKSVRKLNNKSKPVSRKLKTELQITFHCKICNKNFSTNYNLRKHTLSTTHLQMVASKAGEDRPEENSNLSPKESEQKEKGEEMTVSSSPDNILKDMPRDIPNTLPSKSPDTISDECSEHLSDTLNVSSSVSRNGTSTPLIEAHPVSPSNTLQEDAPFPVKNELIIKESILDNDQSDLFDGSRNLDIRTRFDLFAVRKKSKIKIKQLEEAIRILQGSSRSTDPNSNISDNSNIDRCARMIEMLGDNPTYETKVSGQYDVLNSSQSSMKKQENLISDGISQPESLSEAHTPNFNSSLESPKNKSYDSKLVKSESVLGHSSWTQNSYAVYPEQSSSSNFPLTGNYEKHLLEGELEFSTSTSHTIEDTNSSWMGQTQKEGWVSGDGTQDSTREVTSETVKTTQPLESLNAAHASEEETTEAPKTAQKAGSSSAVCVPAILPESSSDVPGWNETPATWAPEPPPPEGESWSAQDGSWQWSEYIVPEMVSTEPPQTWGQEVTNSFFGQLESSTSLGSIMDSVNQILDSRTDGEDALSSLPIPGAFACSTDGTSGSARDISTVAENELRAWQRAMGATDEEMAILQQLGESWPAAGPSVENSPEEEPSDIMDLDRQHPAETAEPTEASSLSLEASEENENTPSIPQTTSGPSVSSPKERLLPAVRPTPLSPENKKKIILQTLMARRGNSGSRGNPEYRAAQDKSLLFEYQDKEMVCPLCHRFFLGLTPLQNHIAATHNKEQVGQNTKQQRPRKSLANLLSAAQQGAHMSGARLLCSQCRELLPDQVSLDRHTKEVHPSASSNKSSDSASQALNKTSSIDPAAAGLKIQMSNVLGSLFDRALSQVLGKGRRFGGSQETGSLNQLSLLQMTLKRGSAAAKSAAAASASTSTTYTATTAATASAKTTTSKPLSAKSSSLITETDNSSPIIPSANASPSSPGSVSSDLLQVSSSNLASTPKSTLEVLHSPLLAPKPSNEPGDPINPETAGSSGSRDGSSDQPLPSSIPEENDKTFACPACDDIFFTLSTRNRHIARAHNGRPNSLQNPKSLDEANSPLGEEATSGSLVDSSQFLQQGSNSSQKSTSTHASRLLPTTVSSLSDSELDADDTDELDGWRDSSPADWCLDAVEGESVGSFLCSDCGINFESPQEVLQHRRLEHSSHDVTTSTSIEMKTSHDNKSCSKAGQVKPLDSSPFATKKLAQSPSSSTFLADNSTTSSESKKKRISVPETLKEPIKSKSSFHGNVGSQASTSKLSHSLDLNVEGSHNKKKEKSVSSKRKERLGRKGINLQDPDDETSLSNDEIRARAEAALRELNKQKTRGGAVGGSKWGLTFTVTESPEKLNPDNDNSSDRKGSANSGNRFNLPLVRKLPSGVGRYTSLAERKRKNLTSSVEGQKPIHSETPETNLELPEKSSLDVYEFEDDEMSPSADLGFRIHQQVSEDKERTKSDSKFDSNGRRENQGGVLKREQINAPMKDITTEKEADTSSDSPSYRCSSSENSPIPSTMKTIDSADSSISMLDAESSSESSKDTLYIKQDPPKIKDKYESEASSLAQKRRKGIQKFSEKNAEDPALDNSDDESDDCSQNPKEDGAKDSVSENVSTDLELTGSGCEVRKRHRSESDSRSSDTSNSSDRSVVAASRRRRAKSDLLISIFAKSKRNFMTNGIARSKSFVNIVPSSDDVSSDDSDQNCVTSEKKVMSSGVL